MRKNGVVAGQKFSARVVVKRDQNYQTKPFWLLLSASSRTLAHAAALADPLGFGGLLMGRLHRVRSDCLLLLFLLVKLLSWRLCMGQEVRWLDQSPRLRRRPAARRPPPAPRAWCPPLGPARKRPVPPPTAPTPASAGTSTCSSA